jgi:site-specific recombinase XerD
VNDGRAVAPSLPEPLEHSVELLGDARSRDLAALASVIVRRGDSPETRRAYASDIGTLLRWLDETGRHWDAVSADDLDGYREWLAARYARSTTNRRLSVVRSLYGEAVRRGVLARDPAVGLRGLRGRDERVGGVLTLGQARDVLEATQRDAERPSRRLRALRDRAILALLLRTGIRRSELASLRIGSLGESAGHHVLTIRGKGNVQRTVKVPVDVRRDVVAWLEATTHTAIPLSDPDDPLFMPIRKGGRTGGREPLSDRAVYSTVADRLVRAGLEHLGPHALRATFVTLALDGRAPIHLVQRAVGHADPRTTERYWRRKDGLDDNAVDYVRL